MQKKLLILSLLFLISVICTGCLTSEPNNEPIITSAPITTASVGVTYNYNVDATDTDGDILTYTLTNPPEGMTINSSNGVINWIPTEEGDYSVTVKVSDGKSTDSQSFTIIVSEVIVANRVVILELFEGTSCSRCKRVHPDIVSLREEYSFDELVILEEYGWDGEYEGWGVIDVAKRFWDYLNYLGISGEFPDAYFNGINQVVHYENAEYDNYKAAIEKELAKSAKIAISATYSVIGKTVYINGSVTNISSDDLNKIVIEAMVYEDSVYSEFRLYNVDHVVRDIVTYEESEEFVESLPSGESYEFSLTTSSLNNVQEMSNIHVVVYVQSPNSPIGEILQALYVE